MNGRLEQRLQSITDGFVGELISLFRGLVDSTLDARVVVSAAKGRGAGKAGKAASARGSSAGSGKGGRRSPAETVALARKVAAFIARHPKGIRVEALGKAIGMKTAQLMLPIKKALAQKLIKRTGEKRATTYFPAAK
ncbi:MAG: hypothetical protein IT370_32050 [Deltaproteobacteria bacterium]|nr:hypothetical protein [Deltaproteobacteria bacterium]